MKLYGEQTGWYYFLNDHLGTPQKIVNASGILVWEAGYMPFGEARVLVADVVNNLRFPGQYFDAETGLHYNWHRYYDPDTGRYLTPDPIGLEGGLNLYAYVDGNPVNWTDPLGFASITVYSEDRKGSSSSSSFSGYGHSWVKIINDDGTSVQRGAYPGGLVDDDYALTSTPEYTWNTTQNDADAATQAIKDFRDWSFFNNNCLDLTENVLDAAGIKHPNFDTWGVSDPANVYKWLNDLNKKSNPCK